MGIKGALGKIFYSRPLTYGYSSARVRARKNLILKKSFYEDLLNQRTMDSIIAMLERTYYRSVLTEGILLEYFTPEDGSKFVEMGAELHYTQVVGKVRSFTPEDGKPVVNMLMRKWDILNLRTIISSRKAGKTWKEIHPYLVTAGELTTGELRKIAESSPEKIYLYIKSTRAGRELLSQSGKGLKGTELEQMFAKALKDHKVLSQLQVLLDASYYNYLQEGIISSDRDVKWIRQAVSKEIDLRNIMNTLRMKRNGASEFSQVEPHIIKGGRARRACLERLLRAKSEKEAAGSIKHLFNVPERYTSLAELEASLQQGLAQERVKIFYRSSLSIATIVGFLFIKEEEMNNLRKIVRGKDYGLSPEDIRPMLVYC